MSKSREEKEGVGKGPSEADIKQESSKAAQKALEAQDKANELKQAAYGAGDPEERQKLMEEAIDKQIEAESFGKTARYMRKGTFQGMAVGAGIGTAPGLMLGTLTGTLVGGVTSAITGGLGAGTGALVGWAHGPFWNMGEVAGKQVQKVTGNLPGWDATAEQKETLERMIKDVHKEDMPSTGDLKGMASDGWSGAKQQGKSAYTTATDYLPGSRASATGKVKEGAWQSGDGARQKGDRDRVDARSVKRVKDASEHAQSTARQAPRKQPKKLEVRSSKPAQPPSSVERDEYRKPRKLEVRSRQAAA